MYLLVVTFGNLSLVVVVELRTSVIVGTPEDGVLSVALVEIVVLVGIVLMMKDGAFEVVVVVAVLKLLVMIGVDMEVAVVNVVVAVDVVVVVVNEE